jgi:ribosome-associated translation inhibitor RaiA
VKTALNGLSSVLAHESLLLAKAEQLEPVKEHLSALRKLQKRLGRVLDTGAMDSEAITESKDYPYTAVAEAKKKLAKHLRKLL